MSRVGIRGVFALVLLAWAAPNSAVGAPSIVYDNTAPPGRGSWTPEGFWPFNYYSRAEESGDEITLAGTDRQIVEFRLVLSSSQAITLEAQEDQPALTLTFYRNDGPDGFQRLGAPGTLLWQGETGPNVEIEVNGPTTVVFSVPNVVVPDTFTWTVIADSDYAGFATCDPPTVGSSGDYFWDRDSTDHLWYPLQFPADPPASGPDPMANFGARVYAVPEPGALALVVLGGLSAGRRGRRSARRQAYSASQTQVVSPSSMSSRSFVT